MLENTIRTITIIKTDEGTSAVPQGLCLKVIVYKLLPLDDVLCVVTVIDRAGHFLLFFIVHLGVDVTPGQLPEAER